MSFYKYTKFEPLILHTLATREKSLGPNHPDFANSLMNLAVFYAELERFDEAELLFNRASEIIEKALGPDHVYMAISFINVASLYAVQGKNSKSELFFKKALKIREKALGLDHPDVARVLSNLSSLYMNQNRHVEAESLNKQALAIREKVLGPNHPDVANTLINLAVLYISQGKYAEAEDLLDQVLGTYLETLGPDHPDAAGCLNIIARNYTSMAKYDKATESYQNLYQSRHYFIDYVFSYASEEQKLRYLQKYPLIDYSFLSFALLNPSEDSERSALEIILKSKAVVIDAMSAEKAVAYYSTDEDVQKKVREHAHVCGEIATVTLAGSEHLKPEIYRDRLKSLYQIKDSLETELSKDCAEFKDELAVWKFQVEDVVKALPEGSVLWEFLLYEPYDFKKIGSDKERTGPPRYLAFTLDHMGKITLADLGDAAEIDDLVSEVRRLIYEARKEVYSPRVVESERRLAEVTGELCEKIFAPLESSLDGRNAIFISPDGQLNLLPFEILVCLDRRYVVEKYKVNYLSSGRDLLKYRNVREGSDWALVIADPDFDLSGESLAAQRIAVLKLLEISFITRIPTRGVSDTLNHLFSQLPNTREEAESVIKTLEDKADVRIEYYHGVNALEEVVKGMESAPRILHLATHGFFFEDLDIGRNRMLENPLLRSGLALAGANRVVNGSIKESEDGEDGILTAFEVSGLNLVGTELVTLSACETGVGEVKNGEGVYGLRRAFQHAGAEAILMSLWKVPDKETYELMVGFYRRWLSGQGKSEALRQSILKIISDHRNKNGTAHPLFWGGFVLVGNPN